MTEVGTLKELDVKPGDVVYVFDAHDKYTVAENPHKTHGEVKTTIGFHYDWRLAEIISRADTPKLWRDMTDAEKGALLLAYHEGKVIEFKNDIDTPDWKVSIPRFASWCYYRVRPEPKVEVVTVYGSCKVPTVWGGHCFDDNTHRITFTTIDGKPDCTSVKMEAI